MTATLFKTRERVIGSVFTSAARYQDPDYAAKVAARPKKSSGETAAPEPAVVPVGRKAARRRRQA